MSALEIIDRVAEGNWWFVNSELVSAARFIANQLRTCREEKEELRKRLGAVKEVKREGTSKNTAILRLEEEVASLEASLEDARFRRDEELDKVANLEDDLIRSAEETVQLKNRLKLYEEAFEEEKARQAELDESVNQAWDRVLEVSHELATAEEGLSELEKRLSEKELELAEVSRKLDNLANDYVAVNNRLNRLTLVLSDAKEYILGALGRLDVDL